ncbi:cadmium-translocating P-type ATPase [Candidatus Kaiserbacteria bacterium]|nr:MAG: cadmium-translocating P-type ATPase [Candidatus Kaiserbacteria bacterium]
MDHSSHINHKEKSSSHASHGGHGMDHGSASSYLKRFWIVTFLLLPLALTNEFIAGLLGIGELGLGKWIQFIIATIIFGFALVFFKHAWHEIKARQYGMMTLVSLAVGAGYLFSVASTFIVVLEVEFYLEISTLVWVLLFGHYLEAKSSGAAGNALQEVAKLLPKQAHKLVDGKEIDVDIAELQEKDVVIVKPGEKIPADGILITGSANVDESLISGESKPIEKHEGDEVVAGSICLDGALTIELVRVGEHSTVGQIQKLIEEAGRTKPRSQKIADKASAILTFVAGITALLTLLVWTLIMGETFVFAITLAITVLVIACPHALGLAIPTVTTITTSLAVKNGFFIKDLSKIEVIRKTDYVVFDKTGTLTRGEFGVTEIVSKEESDKNRIIEIAASLEQHSSHIIGHAIVAHAKEKNIALSEISDFRNIAGQGITAKVHGEEYFAGNERLIKSLQFDHESPNAINGTIVFVANKKELLGYIVLADAIKKESYTAIKALHDMEVKVAMLTGDNEQVAKAVSDELGIDTYFANVLPEDKYTHIKDLQEQGNIVLMVGDGVNDAPALTQANAGVAIGAGTDVAVESGDVVLMDNDPSDIARLITLSKKVYSKMIQNLVWALGYNIIAIPAAAGVFAVWGFFLRPEIGALVMSLSTVIVVVNAMTLKKINLQ